MKKHIISVLTGALLEMGCNQNLTEPSPCADLGTSKMYQQTLPWKVNYDKSAMPAFTLPELWTQQNFTVADWEKQRRPELLQLFKDVMYGKTMPRPDVTEAEILDAKRDVVNGLGLRRQVKLTFKMNNGRQHAVKLLYYLPQNRTPKAIFVGLGFGGNQSVSLEPDLIPSGEVNPNKDPKFNAPGAQSRRFPLEYILSHGYGLAVCCYNDIFLDQSNGWDRSIYDLFYSEAELKKRPAGISAIGAWSWGLSRLLDYLETVPELAGVPAAVFGHSRLGKTALWTGAQDVRFKLVCVNDSGCGGAALSRRLYGETLYSMQFYADFGFWFTDSLRAKALHPENLPLDQHQLIALVAPRSVAIHSATEDQWADPEGEYLGGYYAGPIYKLYGKTPLKTPTPPAADTPVLGDVGYFLRTGVHDMVLSDWGHYIAMAERLWQ